MVNIVNNVYVTLCYNVTFIFLSSWNQGDRVPSRHIIRKVFHILNKVYNIDLKLMVDNEFSSPAIIPKLYICYFEEK